MVVKSNQGIPFPLAKKTSNQNVKGKIKIFSSIDSHQKPKREKGTLNDQKGIN